jgi:formylglycine-generating enzyme required for sulfatase activity
MHLKPAFLIFLFAVAGFSNMMANNLQISNVQVGSGHKISFAVAWENSWNLENIAVPGNHDAVWIFIKYSNNKGPWQHLDLSANAPDHHCDSLDIETVSDGKGVFLKRISKGSGNIERITVTLQWTTPYLSGNFDFKVFGIEMTWIPDGGFYAGDGSSYASLRRGDKNLPFFISSEKSIPIGNDSLSMIDTGKSAPAAVVPDGYPKGYHGFYCMKYEITQEQYADFLNSLTYIQQKAHTTIPPDAAIGAFAFASVRSNRNGITIETPGIANKQPAFYACDVSGSTIFNGAFDGQNRACNFLGWNDLAAYLQWAALRPITELEFEKVCRGPVIPVKQEFAWGTPYAVDANTLINDATDSEHVKEVPGKDSGLASFGYNGPTGALRAGFGATQNSGRPAAGAGFYGTLEMSGNLWELCVVLTDTGLNYTGNTGDGNLPADGYANIAGWPGKDCKGAGHRGGGWNSGIAAQFRDLAVSDRFYVTLLPADRRNTTGGRGGR